MMKSAIIVLSLLLTAWTFSTRSDLETKMFKDPSLLTERNIFKVYKTYVAGGNMNDEQYRHFSENFKLIAHHNSNPNRSYNLTVNRFAFVSDDDFDGFYLGALQNCSATNVTKKRVFLETPPVTIDWRDAGIITPVKDQRKCGSCWTFSTTGCLEAHWALKTNVSPIAFSEQQLVDCADNFNNHGCSGGLPSQAYEYILYNGGISSENAYPYEAKNGTSCRFSPSDVSAFIPGGAYNITAYDEEELYNTVGSIGPVSVAFQVTKDFKFYSGGIYNNPNCSTSPMNVNHAVVAVGYGSENGTDYWIIKNSWNERWGEQGYFRMIRGVNMCGVADCASYPDLSEVDFEGII